MTAATRRATVIAVPARDEADRIEACLAALLSQRDLDGRLLPADQVKVVVLANNCRDATATVAARMGERVQVLSIDFPAAHANAGSARRAAMEAARALLPAGHGLICTTDADSRPRPDWIARLWRAIDDGAEAVAGVVEFDPADAPVPVFSRKRRDEAAYSALQAEIYARIDPEAHNPWPNHIWAWGANLAVTASAYQKVGGLAAEPLAEDRAFVEQLRRNDVPVRHCLKARVWTSPRRAGRAPGGLAMLLDDHAGADRQPCDAALEPACAAFRRAAWRRRLRAAYAGRAAATGWADRLGVPTSQIGALLQVASFGAAWAGLEAASPALARRRLQPEDLPREIARARRLLGLLSRGAPADPADSVLAASAGLWSSPEPAP